MKCVYIFVAIFFISACSQTTKNQAPNEWDFDHHVRFEQKTLKKNSYMLIIQREPRTHFAQLSMFLLRHAKNICQGHGYRLEILEGIEDYDDSRIAQSYIQTSLKAKIECPAK